MLQQIELIDQQIFLFVNKSIANSVFDWFFPFITDLLKQPVFAVGILPFLLALWVYRQRAIAAKGILAAIIVVAVCDLFSFRVIKSIIKRERPNHIVELDSTVRVPRRPPSPSFPSNHATNMFGLAAALSWYLPAGTWFFFIYAALVAFSRVYVGVHFPIDVLAGAILGIGIAQLLKQTLFKPIKWFAL